MQTSRRTSQHPFTRSWCWRRDNGRICVARPTKSHCPLSSCCSRFQWFPSASFTSPPCGGSALQILGVLTSPIISRELEYVARKTTTSLLHFVYSLPRTNLVVDRGEYWESQEICKHGRNAHYHPIKKRRYFFIERFFDEASTSQCQHIFRCIRMDARRVGYSVSSDNFLVWKKFFIKFTRRPLKLSTRCPFNRRI